MQRLLRNARVTTSFFVVSLCIFAWIYTTYQSRAMNNMTEANYMLMPGINVWQLSDLLVVFIMWTVMMMAMMLPAALPMILTFSLVNNKRRQLGGSFVATSIFVAGYLVVWTCFSLGATLIQWLLHSQALLSSMMTGTSSTIAGLLLVITGVFQFSPLKKSCLILCRSPLDFLMTQWREGSKGAFSMGLRHGVYCTGCCWLLMSLLFVLGVMNLYWIALLSMVVLIEKISRHGLWFSRLFGVCFIVWGGWLVF